MTSYLDRHKLNYLGMKINTALSENFYSATE